MRQWVVRTGAGIDGIHLTDVEVPTPGPGEVRVKLKAASINARDFQMTAGRYRVRTPPEFVPLTDGAGEVTAIGSGVENVTPGSRVVSTANAEHLFGPMRPSMIPGMLGVLKDGVLRQEFIVKATGLTPIPDSMSYESAACVPCAGVTAWNSILVAGGVEPGQWVAVLGTGGVAMWALQIAKTVGAQVIVTSSSDAKLDHARQLGADATVNYTSHPDWDHEILAITGGQGADVVVETGGPATYRRSIQAARPFSGRVCVVAVQGSPAPGQDIAIVDAMRRMVSLIPIAIGPRTMQEQMIAVMHSNGIQPVIGARVPFDSAPDAYKLIRDGGAHVGKVVITT